MRIYLNKNKDSSCDYHRIINPFKYFKDTKFEIVDNYKKCDIYIFNRFPHLPDDVFFQEQKKLGFKYVLDLDDYWLLDNEHYLFKMFIKNKVYDRTIKFIKNADFITVTNYNLFLLCRRYNENVEIIENGLPFGHEQFKINKKHIVQPTFGYCGGISHVKDLCVLNNKILNNLDIPFVLLGYKYNCKESNEMLNNLPFKNVITKESTSLDNYMNLYNYIDVSIAPLRKTFFNKCKSNLKIIEAGAKGIPIICSKVQPYYNKLDKKVVTYADNIYDWYKQIQKFSNNKNLVIENGEQLYEHTFKHYNLFEINKKREEILLSLN